MEDSTGASETPPVSDEFTRRRRRRLAIRWLIGVIGLAITLTHVQVGIALCDPGTTFDARGLGGVMLIIDGLLFGFPTTWLMRRV